MERSEGQEHAGKGGCAIKKRLILIAAGALLLACLLPMPFHLKDGGTVEYRAVLYTVSRVRRLNGLEAEKPFQEGLIVKLLGIEVQSCGVAEVRNGCGN